jgi:hypothetical protein
VSRAAQRVRGDHRRRCGCTVLENGWRTSGLRPERCYRTLRFDDPRFERDRLDFFAGTFPPARRASDSPIAIACFRLLTLLPERPDLSVPLFRSCIAFSTFEEAFLPYFRAMLES